MTSPLSFSFSPLIGGHTGHTVQVCSLVTGGSRLCAQGVLTHLWALGPWVASPLAGPTCPRWAPGPGHSYSWLNQQTFQVLGLLGFHGGHQDSGELVAPLGQAQGCECPGTFWGGPWALLLGSVIWLSLWPLPGPG